MLSRSFRIAKTTDLNAIQERSHQQTSPKESAGLACVVASLSRHANLNVKVCLQSLRVPRFWNSFLPCTNWGTGIFQFLQVSSVDSSILV